MSQIDIGVISEVPESQRLDVDGDPSDYALEGGPDEENLKDIYDNPGDVVELSE